MRLLKPLGLTLVAAFVLAAALSVPAFGLELPENLPASTTRTWTGKNIGTIVLTVQAQESIQCTAAKSEGTETTSKPPLGTFAMAFENCTTKAGGITVKCTGLGDAPSVLLVTGTWSLTFDRLIGGTFMNLTTAVVLVHNATHYTCGGLVLAELLAGSETACLHLSPTVKSTTHEFHCVGEIVGGVPKPIEEWGMDVQGVFTNGRVPLMLVSTNHMSPLPALILGLDTVTSLEGGVSKEIFADQ